MALVNIYLNFNGNSEEVFNFYKSVFGGEFTYVGRFGDMPPSDDPNQQVPESDKNKIMHISLPISKETSLMGSDTVGQWAPGFVQGNNFSISINADSKDEADKLFNALAAGGQVTMPLGKTFWGDYFGMLTDKFGINWMMSFNEQQKN